MPNEEQRLVSSVRDQHNWQFEQLIQGMSLVQLTRFSDSFVWPQNNRVCSVKSASKFLYQQANIPFEKSFWSWIQKLHCPKKIQIFIWKSCTIGCQHLAFSHSEINNHCPRCNTPKTTIYILQDGRWPKAVWCQSLSILPLSFFQLSLQIWLQTNSTSDTLILRHQLPWKMYFTFLCWHLWLARNECILTINPTPNLGLFTNQFSSLQNISIQLAQTKLLKLGSLGSLNGLLLQSLL